MRTLFSSFSMGSLLVGWFFIVLPPDGFGEPTVGGRVVARTSIASSTKRRPPRRVMWTTRWMPSTTPLQVTSQGSAPPACMAQLARRESAELALLACTVVSDPPWPVLSACSRSAASPPRTSPTTMWSGRWRSACRTRSRIDTGASEPAAPASKRRQFARSIRSSSVSSMATIRSSSGSSSIRAFRSVVLPRAGASGDQDVPPRSESVAGDEEHLFRQGALADEVLGRERAAPEPADRHRHVGAGRRSADGDPGAVVEPCVEDGPGGRIEPERARDVDRRPVERGGGERRRLDGLELAAAFDPDVAGAVDHQLGDLRVLEHGLESGQERLQVSDPARALHSRPSSRSRQ